MLKHLIIRVSGKVQAVGFRQSTKQEAQRLGLVGTVKNTPDEKVEIHAQGKEQSLRELLNWCKEGPMHADVADIYYKEEKLRSYDNFEII